LFKHKSYLILSKSILIIIFLLISFNQKVQAENSNLIIINEVMACPLASDYYNEWIELFNPTDMAIDLKNWTIDDGEEKDLIIADSDHGNGTTIVPPRGYAIIADQGTEIYKNLTIPENTIKLYVDDSAICGYGLNNNQEKLILSDSSEKIIDTLEWGFDYPDIPGYPAYNVNKGNSIARYQEKDRNNSLLDFYYGITPTPGKKNIVDLDIRLYPVYVSKITKNMDFSFAFAINISLNKLVTNESYQLKSFILGNLSNNWPSTQTWNGSSWRYSNEYTSSITTNSIGFWSGWQYLRFKKDYQDYILNIQNSSDAYLFVKLKKDEIFYNVVKKVRLLDMDESTRNGFRAGYLVGRAEKNNNFFENKIIIVKNSEEIITGIYFTEDNNIEEGLIPKSGYYKIPTPVGTGFQIKIYNQTNLIHVISDKQVKPGNYGVKISPLDTTFRIKRNQTMKIPIRVKNVGDFPDSINISISSNDNNWNITQDKKNINLNPKKISVFNIHVNPSKIIGSNWCNLSIIATSKNDIGISDYTKICIEIIAPDLTITNVKSIDEFGVEKNKFYKGKTATIKANIKNRGNENATNVTVSFYCDNIDKNSLIGKKEYESISKYHKYPSILWDTSKIKPGFHTIFTVLDHDNNIEELNELNNEFSIKIEIITKEYSGEEILITELYYHTYSNLNNEYIALYNPTKKDISISSWYITNNPEKNINKQTKIVFPDPTILLAKTKIYITQNASAYCYETGKVADFEYSVDSSNKIPQMIKQKNLRLSNMGGAVAIKDQYNKTFDILVYGDIDSKYEGWNGPPVFKSGQGVITKRNRDNYENPIDSDSCIDWNNPRIYGIGQSDFPYVRLPVFGEIKTFVSPDCSFKTIVSEIRNASESIYFNIYEFTNPFLCNELVDALNRNVNVNIFLEGSPIGGIDDREKYILNTLKNNGAHIRLIVNDVKNKVHARYIFDHGKYLVIDNKTIIVESCNWAKTGVPIDPTFGNREWGIVVKNQIVAEYFLKIFMDDWNPNRCDSYSLSQVDTTVPSGFYIDDSVYYGEYKPQYNSLDYTGNFTAIPVFSPDTSYKAICEMIDNANTSIYIQQLYVYKDWKDCINPFIDRLINKSNQGVDIRIILNYNPAYEATNIKCNETKNFLKDYGIQVKFLYTNWSYFTNIHNKGMIVDNKSVLISSINWNENSVTRNREAGLILENYEIASYYADVFLYDWQLKQPEFNDKKFQLVDYKNHFLIVLIYGFTFGIITRDWRKRRWTS